MLGYPTTTTIREIVNHFERVYIDGSVLSADCKQKKLPWGLVCEFSEHLGKAQSYRDVSLRILRQKEGSVRELSKLLQEINLYTTEEVATEYSSFINHIKYKLKWFRKHSNERKGKKQRSLEQILRCSQIIRNRLKIEPPCGEYILLLKTRRLHLPRVQEFTKIIQPVEGECSDADASLVSAALSFRRRVAIVTHDKDISNLVFNYGQDLRRDEGSHQVVVYFLDPHFGNKFHLNFSSNDQLTYRNIAEERV